MLYPLRVLTREDVERSDIAADLTLPEAADMFLEHCEAKNLSTETVQWYRNHLERMLQWVKENFGITTVGQVDKAHLQAFISHRKAQGQLRRDGSGKPYDPPKPLSAKKLRDYIASARVMWNWLVDEGIAAENPAARLPKPKLPRKVVENFSEQDVRDLLGQVNRTTFRGLRDYAAMTLMLGTGIRLSEMLNLGLSDVDLRAHTIKVMGKGAKERELPLSPRVESTLRRWLKMRQRAMSDLAERVGSVSDFVFPGESGQRMHARNFYARMRKYGRRAGIQVRCSPHTLRHTFALNFIRNGGQPFQLQVLLGHSDLAMTRRYCNLAAVDAFEQGRLYNPIENLGLGDEPAARIPRNL